MPFFVKFCAKNARITASSYLASYHLAFVIMKARLCVVFVLLAACFLSCDCIAEKLVLTVGEEHSILCKSPDGANYGIQWTVNAVPVDSEYMDYTVGEEETLTDGMKGKRIMFTAAENASLRCFVTDFLNVDSFDPLEIDIIIQGFQAALWIKVASM